MLQRSSLFLCLFMSVSFLVHAQISDLDQVNLTAGQVEKFIGTYPKIAPEFEALGVKYNKQGEDISLPEGTHYLNQVNNIVKQNGYTDYTEYAMEAGAVLATYAAIKLDMESSKVQPEIQSAIEEINKNPQLTAEQKESMIAMIREGSAAMMQMSEEMTNSKNIEVVKPFTEALDKLLNEE